MPGGNTFKGMPVGARHQYFFKFSGESTMQQNLKDDFNNVCKR